MYDQIQEDAIFIMLYAVVMTMAALGSCYLLFRRGNAFAEDVKSPVRLRRWTAAFLGITALGHLWYMPAMVFDLSEAVELFMLIGGLLDCIFTIPVALIVMLCMMQDRRRPLWPVIVAVAPLVVMMAVSIVMCSYALLPWIQGYFLLVAVAFTIYMVREVRRYGRWLRDNFADLEHKEVSHSLLVLAAFMILFVYYVMCYGSITYEYIIQVCGLLLIGFLLWRVETLSSLTPDTQQTHSQPLTVMEGSNYSQDGNASGNTATELSTSLPVREGLGESLHRVGAEVGLSGEDLDDIKLLLKQHCEDTRLYLQHDLTHLQLAKELGINRTYLSLYFARHNTTYNAYINDLRIFHFVRLYREAMTAGRDFTAQELAAQSGYRSYRTFSQAFKERMGQTVKKWMSAEEGA